MENQEYLDQLAAKVRPEKAPKSGLNIFGSIYVKIILGTVAALIILALLGSLLSGMKGKEGSKVLSLNARITNTANVIKTYQANLKSSDLRSSSVSLASMLANTTRDLSEIVAAKYAAKDKETEAKITKEETEAMEELQNELFSAKINGILDRVFAAKMAYEISVITTREAEIINTTKNEDLKEVLTTSYNSLANLYDKFDDFSEAN